MKKNAQKNTFKSLAMTSFGGSLEFYDFIIFALFGVYFSKVIFPAADEGSIIPLLQTYAVFAVGYIARPFGGLIIGHLGDTVGRKKAMIITISVMTLSTLAMGLIPTYATIGLLSPIIFSLLRIIQGIALGGELPGCISYISEAIPKHRGLACSIVFSAVLHGISLGALVEWGLSHLLTSQELYAWGWRVPFILGAFFGLLTFYLRIKAEETSTFLDVEEKTERPIMELLKRFPVQAVGGALITGYIASIVSLVFLVMNSYLLTLNYGSVAVSNTELINILVSATLIIFWGYISDKFNTRIMLAVSVIIFMFVAPMIYTQLIHHQGDLLNNLLILGVFFSIAWGSIPKTLSEIFPTEVRYTGVAFSYNLGFAILGGLAPVIVTAIIAKTGNNLAPVWYLWVVSVLCLAGLAMIYFSNRKLGIHDHLETHKAS